MLSDLVYRLRALFRRGSLEAEMNDELLFHLEQEVSKYEKSGLSHAEALRRARLAFGGIDQTREECREVRGISFFETSIQDLLYGLRQMRHSPGFATVAVLTLAVGIAANTTIFSAVSAILLRKPPVKDPDRLCTVSSKNLSDDLVRASAPDFLSWQKENNVFRGMAAALTGRSFTLTGKNEPQEVRGDRVTPDYFQIIGVMPVLGRAFLPNEAQAGNDHVVILSNALWRERFSADPNVIGESLKINGERCTIVGVMPPRAEMTVFPPQLWMPLVFGPEDLTSSARGNHYIDLVLGRLKPGVTVKRAQAQMNSIARRLALSYPKTNKDWGVTVLTLQEYKIRSVNVRNGMMLIVTAVGLVLLIACANIAGLLLARGAGRAHELAIRSALGASRARLLRQMLAESLILGVAGGGAGLLLSIWGIQLLRAGFNFNEYGREVAVGFRLDQPTLLFALAMSLLTTIVFGLLPALRASKTGTSDALSDSGRTGTSFGRSRLRSALVTGEIALALVLLTAAGVIMRQIVHEFSEPNGFNPRHLVIANLDVNSRRYKQLDARIALFEQVTDKLRQLPGVESADMDSCVPMGCFYSISFDIAGRPPVTSSRRPSANFFVVGPDYFRTMQIPVLKGREFSVQDDVHAPIVAIVNQEFARRFFPKENAIGKQIEVKDGNHKQAQIVGIVGNVNQYVGEITPQPQIYECYLQIPVNAFSAMAVMIRSRVASAALAPALRKVVWSVDKDQPVGKIQTMQDLVADNVGGDKLMAGLMGIFAGLALALAAVGIYGLIAYSVAQRTREIGIRMALGAQPKNVLGLVLRQGGILIAIGCAIGTLLALPLPRLLSGLFNAFSAQGPGGAVVVALIIALVSLLATYIPARRAAKMPPITALRHE